MDKLPQEVVDKITGFMFPLLAKKTDEEYDRHPHNKRYAPCNYERDDLSAAPYATLSPVWKRSIEQLTFWILKIRSHSDALIAEEAMSRDLHRRNSVRRIAWTINLDVERTSSFPHIRDKVIVVEFRNMLEFINRIRPSSDAPKLLLTINIVGMGAWDAESGESAFTAPPPGIHELPVCPAVTGLHICYDVNIPFDISEPMLGRKVPPVWIVEILSKLPSVTTADWEFYDFLNRRSEKRALFRNEVCKALKSPLFANLQVLCLYIGSYHYYSGEKSKDLEEYVATPRVEPSENGEDGLNAALRTVSQSLVELIIQGTFTLSPDFFHKRNGEAHEQPSWPRLEFLAIETTNITCTGNLYLPDANESTITWHESFFIDDILRKPTNDFNELMLSLSRGMLSMPKLQRLEILVRCNPNGIYYPLPYGARDSLSFRDIKLHRLIYYDREENESVPLAEFPPKDLWCNLGIFDRDYFRQRYIEVPCQLPWTACPEEALRNWNELHFRIKGHSILPEWRRKIVENGYQEDYVGYPFIQSARWVKQ